jgi:hypothetical protein
VSEATRTDGHLSKAASYVRQLIAHVANEGSAQLDTGALTSLLVAVGKIDKLTPEEEADFWKDYQALVKLALPARVEALSFADYVSVETLDDTADPEAKKIARQQSSLRRIRRISIAAFTVTLTLFAYLSITESAILRNNAISRSILILERESPRALQSKKPTKRSRMSPRALHPNQTIRVERLHPEPAQTLPQSQAIQFR